VRLKLAKKTFDIKIVYYGRGMAGKSSSMTLLEKAFPDVFTGAIVHTSIEGDVVWSLRLEPKEPLRFRVPPHELTCEIDVSCVPRACYYNATRRLALQGADGIIFVADSQPDAQEENKESLQNLADNLKEQGLDLDTIPLVFQWNKRDLPDILPVAELEKTLNPLSRPSFETVAIAPSEKKSALAAFVKLLDLVFEKLGKEYGFVRLTALPDPEAAVRPSPHLARIREFDQRVVGPAFEEIKATLVKHRKDVRVVEGQFSGDPVTDPMLALMQLQTRNRPLGDLAASAPAATAIAAGEAHYLGKSLVVVEQERSRYPDARAGRFVLSIEFTLGPGDAVFVAPVAMYHMAWNDNLHVFAHRFKQDVPRLEIRDVTRHDVLNYFLGAFDFYKIHAHGTEAPPGFGPPARSVAAERAPDAPGKGCLGSIFF
jgi:GTPase SAR1 family protein